MMNNSRRHGGMGEQDNQEHERSNGRNMLELILVKGVSTSLMKLTLIHNIRHHPYYRHHDDDDDDADGGNDEGGTSGESGNDGPDVDRQTIHEQTVDGINFASPNRVNI